MRRTAMNTITAPVSRLQALVSVPWNAFIAAFLYYTFLTVLAVGGTSPGAPVVVTAYGIPVGAYTVTIAVRLARLTASWLHATAPARPQTA
jgi:hypothetical protein